MGDLSDNFSRSEFTCKCGCGMDTVDAELIKVLQYLRDITGKRITVTSGNRCPYWNERQGGGEFSKHKEFIAADIKVEDYTAQKIYDLLDATYPDKYGVGLYSTWVHIDVRSERARW